MRRHRLNGPEVSPVKEAVENELRQLCQERKPGELFKAQMLFRVSWRLKTHRQGQPDYPNPQDWPTMSDYIMVPFYGREAYKPVEPPVMRAVASVGGGEGSDPHSSSTHQKRRIINDEE